MKEKYNLKAIGITGTNGKTSTKEILATLLSEKFTVTKTLANNNNHIGVPLTIFSADTKTDYLVLEQGTNHFGEIEYTAKITKPDIALITNIGEAHTQYLVNREGVYKEKSALLDAAQESGGKILINSDDPILKQKTKSYKNRITFGFKGAPDIKGQVIDYSSDGQPLIAITSSKKNIECQLPIYGEPNAKNYLAAVAVAISIGMTKKDIITATKKLKAVKGRLDVMHFEGTVIIDDTYNANPESMHAGFALLKKIKTVKNKIAVLGDMFELGKDSTSTHTELAKGIVKNKINNVFLLGKEMKNLEQELHNHNINATHFRMRKSLVKALANIELENSAVLLKGSRGMQMEEFVNLLIDRVQ